MANVTRKNGPTVSTRNGYPIRESMSTDSVRSLVTILESAQNRQNHNAAMMRRVHHN